MKRALILLFLMSLCCMGCKDEPTPPEEKPEGYQEGIPWPSLADSPWPRHRGNAQNTGRSTLSGIISGKIAWRLSISGDGSGSSLSHLSMDSDSIIYFASSYEYNSPYYCYLYAIKPDGEIKWKFPLSTDSTKWSSERAITTPLIGSNRTVYVGSEEGILFAINSTGDLKWKYKSESEITSGGINLDKNGKIYFLTYNGFLYSINQDGTLNWKLYLDGGFASSAKHGVTFSPDGKVLYVAGREGSKSLYAISIQKEILWSFSSGRIDFAPLVDAQGNIYFSTESSNKSIGRLVCLKNNGQLKWEYFADGISLCEIAIDRNGNLYFQSLVSSDAQKLVSLNHEGVLRWSTDLMHRLTSELICDEQGNIYSYDFGSVVIFNSSGKQLSTILIDSSYQSLSPIINYNSNLYIGINRPNKSIIAIN